LAPVASLVSVHHLKLTGWGICLLMIWYFGVLACKIRLESGLFTADSTTTVIHSYKLLTNNVKPVQSLILSIGFGSLDQCEKQKSTDTISQQ